MPGPARAGLFVYAKDLDRMASFYESVATMARLHATDELIVLQSPDFQLLVHRIPTQFADGIVITSPPQRRENSALKFFFTVESLAETGSLIGRLGGAVFPEQWQGPGFVVKNACDPEGNVFQIRQGAGSWRQRWTSNSDSSPCWVSSSWLSRRDVKPDRQVPIQDRKGRRRTYRITS